MVRRSRMEILAAVLALDDGDGVNKTRLVYGAYVNFDTVKKYIEELTDKGLMVKEGDLYFRTEKGDKWLEWFRSAPA